MRLIDADALLNLQFERMIHTDYGDTCVPIEEIETAPTVCGNNPKWCENCVSRGSGASTRPHIIDNCDMNVFEPEELLERYKEEENGES